MGKSLRVAPAFGLILVAASAAIVLIWSRRSNLSAKTALKETAFTWSKEVGTDSVFLPKTKSMSGMTFHALKDKIHSMAHNSFSAMKAHFEMLEEVAYEEPSDDIKTMEMEYNLCESCFTSTCPYFLENDCDVEYVKPQCMPEVLLAACPDCGDKGCQAVLDFVQNDAGLNETAGGDNITKISVLRQMNWADARHKAVESFPDFRSCIASANTVALAENCLVEFLHPFPADLLKAAARDAAEMGPPVCSKNYLGGSCSPLPTPADNKGTCPKGFMCMPDPNNCEQCACSCTSPADKISQLEACLTHAPHAAQGLYCLQSFFTQLSPEFVNTVVTKADEPRNPDEQYFLILNDCGGPENGTEILNTCLEEVDFCVRPRQGLPGEFPTDAHQFQSICECFRDPKVLAACGPEPANQTQCVSSVRDIYVQHVHHKYCVTHTEAACNFECAWPLPGFFGDLITKGKK